MKLKSPPLSQNVKGKVIIACLLACVALGLSWYFSRAAFNSMLITVEKIASPNERLRLVNKLSKNMVQLDHLQRSQSIQPQSKNYLQFALASRELRLTMDSLALLYADNHELVHRIDSMKLLLKERDKIFMHYLKVRKGLINNKNFSAQIEEMSDIINDNARQKDSTIYTTKKTVSTFIIPTNEQTDNKRGKGFFGRIFGRDNKAKSDSSQVREEIEVAVDTTALARKDSIMKAVDKTIRYLETKRKNESRQFINKEAELVSAGHILVLQMQTILEKVEHEVVKQVEKNNQEAKMVVNTGIKRIGLIIVIFFALILVLLFLILTDITKTVRYRRDLEKAKEEAEYHSQAKQRFLANMSHEIRTPLQSILGYADLVKQQPNPKQKDLDAIYQSSNHLLQIVNEVLDYSRITSGKFTFHSKVFNVTPVIQEVMMAMEPQARKKNLQLHTVIAMDENQWVKGDPFRLKQILFNLLSNAIKFTESGSVELRVSSKPHQQQNHLQFNVSDTGIGIAENKLKQIFETFEHHNTETDNPYSSTGLGLSIVKELITAMGGRIYVKSEPQKGSVFMVYLSFESTAPMQPATGIKDAKPLNAFDGKVWIVDDDRFILDLCDALLNKHQISHRCFSSPDDILGTTIDPAVNCILMDIRMPGMNGTELLKIMRNKVGEQVKIFALTAQVLPEEQESFMQHGFDGLLMKPFREEEFIALIHNSKPPVQITDSPDISFNLSQLEKMAFGDNEQIQKILERFIEDSRQDIQTLELAFEQQDAEKTSLLLHRIAGRTAQIGAKKLAAQFRKLELDSLKEIAVDSHTLGENIVALQQLIRQVEKEIKHRFGISPSYYTKFSDQY